MCRGVVCGGVMCGGQGSVCFFFFKHKTAYEMLISDWSSDVCSSDLNQVDRLRIVELVDFIVVVDNRHRPSHKVDEQPLTVCEHRRHADVSQRKTLQYVDHGLAPVWWEHQGSRVFGCPASLEDRKRTSLNSSH